MVDLSTAPQNVSVVKVAQGWVINWLPPERVPNNDKSDRATAAASLLPALSQLQSGSEPGTPTDSSLHPAAYSVEFRERSSNWQPLASSRERSLLLKDLKPGAEYQFRVFAHSAAGGRGSASPELKYLVADTRRKPGGTQALSAGVVSGFLFFVACIVIAVCAVNMCNKRRKKRAEKGES